jgi:tripartite-type tricarboxylate transporter receptor subunit TctC
MEDRERPIMTMGRRQFLQLATGAAALPALTAPARAQTYPARPVRVVVPVAPGGANDTTARLVAQKLSEHLGQQFYCENQVGAGGNIAFGATAKAPKDGYTLLAAGGNFIINPSLYARVPYDPFTDFAPVSLLCSSPHVVAVHPSVRAANMQEFVALLKANPGKFSYGSAGRGTPAHLAGELFRLTFGLDIAHVPFGGGGPAMTATIGNHIPMTFAALPTAAPYVKAGNVRALAMMSGKRSLLLPDVPTMAELGSAGLEADIVTGLVVPIGTPSEIIDVLHRALVTIMAAPDFQERLAALGFEAVANTPQQFAAWIRSEVDKWAKVIRDAAITLQ